MNRAHKIKLIGKTYTEDDIGQQIPTETERNVFAYIRDVSQTESARPIEGLTPSKVFDVHVTEYENEEDVEYKGVRYRIYRTYLNDDSRMELYGARRTGA
jgi:SPP1 family predicted phage head-tail adaptor